MKNAIAFSRGGRVLVVDASVLIDLLLNRTLAPKLRERLLLSGEGLAAPAIIDLEVLQTLRRDVLAGTLGIDRADEAVGDLMDLRIERYPHDPLIHRVWELRSNVTAYDAAYVALAEKLNAPLVTLDQRLVKACRMIRVEVIS